MYINIYIQTHILLHIRPTRIHTHINTLPHGHHILYVVLTYSYLCHLFPDNHIRQKARLHTAGVDKFPHAVSRRQLDVPDCWPPLVVYSITAA